MLPEPGSLTLKASALTSFANVLTGEAATDDVDFNSVSGQSVGCESADVVIAGHLGPVFRQHAPAEWINLAEGDRLKTARALKAKAETANAAEQVKDAELAHSTLRSSLHVVRTTLIVWR